MLDVLATSPLIYLGSLSFFSSSSGYFLSSTLRYIPHSTATAFRDGDGDGVRGGGEGILKRGIDGDIPGFVHKP